RLDAGPVLGPMLLEVLAAADYGAREEALVAVVEELARRHNALGLTRAVEPTVRLFHTRPFRVLGSHRFVDACLERVTDPWLRSRPLIGGADQWIDSTDALGDPRLARAAYEASS
ncbi:MAG TPA: hypothetical protein VLN26_04200, partial [Gaiellaceae bacterium]|nr:hypothetical protein [Gaiellaceae bacterium]